MEAGQLYFAWRNGVLAKKLQACLFFCLPANLARLLRRRCRESNAAAGSSDREFTRSPSFPRSTCPELRSPDASPSRQSDVFARYWRLIRPLIRLVITRSSRLG